MELDDTKSCLICIDVIDEPELYFLPCMHFFHENCICIWLKKNMHCPLCRVPIFIESPEQLEKFNTFTLSEKENKENHVNNLGTDINSVAYRFMRAYNIRNAFNYNDRVRLEEYYDDILDTDSLDSSDNDSSSHDTDVGSSVVPRNPLGMSLRTTREFGVIARPNNLILPDLVLNSARRRVAFSDIVNIWAPRTVEERNLLFNSMPNNSMPNNLIISHRQDIDYPISNMYELLNNEDSTQAEHIENELNELNELNEYIEPNFESESESESDSEPRSESDGEMNLE